MSLWSNIVHRLKEMLKSMVGSRTIEQTLHVAPVISSQMEAATRHLRILLSCPAFEPS